MLPSFVLTVIVAVPSVFAVINPMLLTLAIVSLLLLQLTVLLFALLGSMVAVNCSVSPSVNVTFVWFNVIPVTSCVTVIGCDIVSILFPATSTVNTCK